ncbi:MAG: ABC transporter permease [Oligoflexia bacterium]|nr:ABC transporter permease [Oligoflexia bacterium]
MSSVSQTSAISFVPDFFVQMYGYREYLKQSVLRDLRNKYKRSFLGYIWTMLHPLAMMSVLAVVFSHIMRVPVKDYAVFLFAGLLPWNYFNSTALMSLHTIRANARLFSQIPVPKYIFILSLTFSNLANLLFALVPLLIISIVMGRGVPLTALAFPIVLIPLFLTVVGISLILATSNVFFDDTLHLAEVGLNMLYFMSPVLFHRELLPGWITQYLVLNPLFCQIEFVRNIFYDGVLPDPQVFAINLCGAAFVLFLGLFIFRKSEDKFLYFL